MFTKILVPMDGSEVSEAILPGVAYLARGLDIPVELLSLVDPGTAPVTHEAATPGVVRYQGRLPFISYAADERYYTGIPGRGEREVDPSVRSRYQYDYFDQNVEKDSAEDMIEVQKWLDQRAAWLEQQGVSVVESKVAAAIGKPSEGIIEYADFHSCDLITMATHDRNLLGQAVRGSVTNSVIRSSHVPVLAITPEKQASSPDQPVALSSVLVPLDGSQFAEAVLPYVENLAGRLGLEVVLVQVLGFEEVFPPAGGMAVPPGETTLKMDTTPEQVAATDANQYLENVAERLTGMGLKARWEVIRGDAAQEVAKLAQRTPDTMIALASHSRSGISRWVTGSVAEELLRASGDPVLVISSELAEGEEERHAR
jgi:nucleotide-binding universal stress UspA family protein